ncbi:hypothetical protein DV738_g357, partial [Chaetothyriales sp. CBS 135597]
MDGPPACSLEGFKEPFLRKCPFDLDTLTVIDRINPAPYALDGTGGDGGLDGYNWIVDFKGSSELFVLKIFWDNDPPRQLPAYFAAQRECQNAALLQMIQEAVQPEHSDLGPILIRHQPQTRSDAEANLFAFSDERRLKRLEQQRSNGHISSSLHEVTTIPRMRKCYGWLQITTEDLYKRMPRNLRARAIDLGKIKRFIRPGTASQTTSQPTSGEQSFADDLPANWDYNVQYRAIPWKDHGKKLTGKLALWALAMMSLNGDNEIEYSYPGLNTWRRVEDGGFMHNTTGERRTLGRGCVRDDPM